MCRCHISPRHLFWSWLHEWLCRKWCRNSWTVGMAETEEEALRWKVHLKGFGNNPLKLPQGIWWNGLHLYSPLCSCHSLGVHLLKVVGLKKKIFFFFFFGGMRFVILSADRSYFGCPEDAVLLTLLGDYSLNSCHYKKMPVTRRSKDHWFCISLIKCLADARRLSPNPCCFSPFYLGCHFDFIMQDLCWVHNPLKWGKGCNPFTQAAAQLLGSWEKTCGTNPTVTRRTLGYLTICGSHLIILSSQCYC